MGRWIIWLGWLLALCCVGAPAAWARGPAGHPFPICIARSNPALSAAEMLRHPRGFDCTRPQLDFGPGDFDVLSVPLSGHAGVSEPAHLRFGSVWQRRVTIHALYADGTIGSVALDGHALSRAIQLGAMVDVTLPFHRSAVRRVLWRIEGAGNVHGLLLGPHLGTAADTARANMLLAGVYAGFAGLTVALLIYNLALWCALRHRFQLAYCAMMAGLLVYALSSSGTLAWWWPGIANNDRLRINYLSLSLSAAAAVAFARAYFEPRVFAGWVGWISRAVMATLIGTALAFAIFAPWHAVVLDRIYTASFVGLIAIVVPVLVRAWCQRSNYLWLFALTWGTPIVFATMRTLAAFGLIGWSFWIDNSTVLAMIVEGLLSSVAIAYRIYLLSRERDEAREQEIAARLLADTDPLTGLLNRRAFLHHAIGREREQTLVIVDIDHFKRVNETIGHDGGDEVLRIVARTLRQSAGENALVARLGGEEFAILSDTGRRVEPGRLLDALRNARMPYDLTVTASIGSCTGPIGRETEWKRLYRNADRALFAAKSAGRDRVRDAASLVAA